MSKPLETVLCVFFLMCLLSISLCGAPIENEPESQTSARQSDLPPRPQVEVVFCLDTTGSMSGLIEGAKQKIWAIANQIASGQPTPKIKVGLVAYRDRKDAYVTRVSDLTDDLDAVYAQLREFRAEGGGDTPESVNQALHESLTKINWSNEKRTLRIIFLVGDAPPHTDYQDDVPYLKSCERAAERGIIINTIQCGNMPETAKVWQEICRNAEGSYVQIAQNGGVAAIATPFDAELSRINSELAQTTLVYGDRRQQAAGAAKQSAALQLSAEAAADRAAFSGKLGVAASYDLLDALKSGKVRLEEIKTDELPAELQKLTPEERRKVLDKLRERRAELNQQAIELDKKRSDFIFKKLAENGKANGKDGFDNQVLDLLRNQAKKQGISY